MEVNGTDLSQILTNINQLKQQSTGNLKCTVKSVGNGYRKITNLCDCCKTGSTLFLSVINEIIISLLVRLLFFISDEM